jgi:hypothetical protein
MNNYQVEVSQLLGKFYVAYSKLETIVNALFAASTENISHINIYLDINSMTKVLYGNIDFRMDERLLISASIVNLCAHYRSFFRRYYNTETTFYIIDSHNLPLINRRIIKDYNISYAKNIDTKRDLLNKVKVNIECTKMLCEYLPEIYVIPTTFETGVIVRELMGREQNKPTAHMVITKDPYNYQLITDVKNSFILRPVDKEKTYFVESSNLFKVIEIERGLKRGLEPLISSQLYSILLSLIGIKERNIKSIFSIHTAMKMIQEGIESNCLVNGYNHNPNLFFSRINGVNPEELKNRFEVIDLIYQHKIFVTHPEFQLLDTFIIDKHNPQEVREICSKYYLLDPIDLERL